MKFRTRLYEIEAAACSLPRHTAHHHPLSSSPAPQDYRGVAVAAARRLSASRSISSIELGDAVPEDNTLLDPLRASAVQDPLTADQRSDLLLRPLRWMASKGAVDQQAEAAAEEWNGYKTSMLQRFTSTGTIKVSAKLDILSKESRGRGRSLTLAHLEELDDPGKEAEEEGKIISQQEYVTRLRDLNDEISQSWLNNERVSALRLSIKVAKLLSDTSVPQFYPTLFVMVTDVMETVGNLVWNRIKGKAEMDETGKQVSSLPENFTADDVCQEAKDTCNNWFYKIGSIHELLPRIYLEIAILRCLRFLRKDPPIPAFQRLTMMIRGLADPLTSAYARLYLARQGQAIIPYETGFLITGLDDYLLLFRRVLTGEFDKTIGKAGVDPHSYINLVEPVFEWIVQCIFKHASSEERIFLIKTFGEQHNGLNVSQGGLGPVSVMVHYILKQLPATIVGNHALELSEIVRNSNDHSMPQYLNYRLLGEKLCECNPPRESRLTMLNDVWKVVMKYSNLVEYLTVTDVFVEYILQSCSEVELNVILRDVMKHLKNPKVEEAALTVLESIIFKLMTYITDLRHLLDLPYFVNILDVFYGDMRISVYKRIVASVSRNNEVIFDPVTRHFLFELCKGLHDSLDSLSSEDDHRQISRLISRVVQLVDFGRDLEQHLSFLVDCRGTFANMDLLRETVVHLSNRLAMSTLKILKGAHSEHSITFVKACVTFSEITIPSIKSVIKRIHLYLETSEVALMNALLSHVEGLLKCSISCLQEIQNPEDMKTTETEEGVTSFIQKLCSFLIVVPGHPEFGGFYLIRGLSNLVNSQPWLTQGQRKVKLLCGVLSTCSAFSQACLPYHVNNMEVTSNDELFCGEQSYQEELANITSDTVEKISSSTEQATSLIHGNQALDVCNMLLTAFEMNDEEVNSLYTSLMRRAVSSLPKDNKYLQSTLNFAQYRGLTAAYS